MSLADWFLNEIGEDAPIKILQNNQDSFFSQTIAASSAFVCFVFQSAADQQTDSFG